MLVFALIYISCEYFKNLVPSEYRQLVLINSNSVYAKCHAISGQSKEIKLNYLINKALIDTKV